ncbi:hypothetical protein D3C75_1105970 [compost metagenome]
MAYRRVNNGVISKVDCGWPPTTCVGLAFGVGLPNVGIEINPTIILRLKLIFEAISFRVNIA